MALGAVASVGGALSTSFLAWVALAIRLFQVGANRASLVRFATIARVLVQLRARALVPVVRNHVVGAALSAVAGVIVALVAVLGASSAPRPTPVLVTITNMTGTVVVIATRSTITPSPVTELSALLTLGAFTSHVLAFLAVVRALVAPSIRFVLTSTTLNLLVLR
jgi:hypothetical protein